MAKLEQNMAEPVIYLRGLSPPPVSDPAMIADLKVIGDLSKEQIEEIVARLAAATGFLDPKAVKSLARNILSDARSARAIQRALQNLEPDSVEMFLENIDRQRKGDQEVAIGDREMVAIRRNLTRLVQPYPALTRFEKAERLATLTGLRLESVDLICDLRPIFNDSRQNVEGMMPYTRLRVVAIGVDGLPRSFEAELSARQVRELSEKASKAEVKLDALREAIEVWVPDGVPDLPLTRPPREESSDA